MENCKHCGNKIDLLEIKRQYRIYRAIFYGGFCSAQCFTKHRLNKFDGGSKEELMLDLLEKAKDVVKSQKVTDYPGGAILSQSIENLEKIITQLENL